MSRHVKRMQACAPQQAWLVRSGVLSLILALQAFCRPLNEVPLVNDRATQDVCVSHGDCNSIRGSLRVHSVMCATKMAMVQAMLHHDKPSSQGSMP